MELSVGVKIKEIRKGMRISQTSLAKMAGIGQSTLSDIENLTMNPSAKTLLLLADALGNH